MTEGGSARSDQIRTAIASPPMPAASPPQGGRRGFTRRSPKGELLRLCEVGNRDEPRRLERGHRVDHVGHLVN